MARLIAVSDATAVIEMKRHEAEIMFGGALLEGENLEIKQPGELANEVRRAVSRIDAATAILEKVVGNVPA